MPRQTNAMKEGPQDYGHIAVLQVGTSDRFEFNPRAPEGRRCSWWRRESNGDITIHTGDGFVIFPVSVILKVVVKVNGPDAIMETRARQHENEIAAMGKRAPSYRHLPHVAEEHSRRG